MSNPRAQIGDHLLFDAVAPVAGLPAGMSDGDHNSFVMCDRHYDHIAKPMQRELPDVVTLGEAGHTRSATWEASCLADSARNFVEQQRAVAFPFTLMELDGFGEFQHRLGM